MLLTGGTLLMNGALGKDWQSRIEVEKVRADDVVTELSLLSGSSLNRFQPLPFRTFPPVCQATTFYCTLV
jgi:hypothetical protein